MNAIRYCDESYKFVIMGSIPITGTSLRSSVAELLTFNQDVAGSIPAGGTGNYKSIRRTDIFMIKLNIKPWCTCIERSAWRPQDGWRLDPPSGLWVHPRCNKPSIMNYQRLVEGKSIIAEDRDMGFMRGEVDIYRTELRIWAESVISEELDWDLTEE